MKRSGTLWLVLATALAALVQPAAPTLAQTAPFCRPGQPPAFEGGLGQLRQVLLTTMGSPIECEHPDRQTGEVIQRTTTGLAYYRKETGTPTFTSGREYWALPPAGSVYWTVDNVDSTIIPWTGAWGRHGFGFILTEDGRAQVGWRVYQWCEPGVTGPCDRISADGEIMPGGRAEIGFFPDQQLPTAQGIVSGSTDPSVLRNGLIGFTLLPYGMAALEDDRGSVELCGPNFWDLAPPSLRDASPCGA